MAGTTTKMVIPYPESTDFVADGATAMENLADAVDDNTGLVRIQTGTFANPASAVSFDNAFSSSFDNYRIVWTVTASELDNTIVLRLRSGGSDNTTTNYVWTWLAEYMSGGSYGSSTSGGQTVTLGTVGYKYSSALNGGVIDIYGPLLSSKTSWTHQSSMATGALDSTRGGGAYVGTASFDGFSLISQSGWMTGTATVYGYNL